MASGGFGVPTTAMNDLSSQKMRAEQVVRVGAGWFIWIAALSVVNSVVGWVGGGVHFIVGLGVTQFVDALSKQAGSSGLLLDVVINGFVVGVFALFWNFARKGQSWAFILGMSIYALDGLLLLLFKDIFSVAFHGYALYRIYQGMSVLPVLHRLEAALAPADAPIVPR